MDINFKNEFKSLNANKIKEIVNRCAGQDILNYSFSGNKVNVGNNDLYSINYIEDENFGFWMVQWNWEKNYHLNILLGGQFQNSIKITPFNIFFNITTPDPYKKMHKQQLLKDYLHIYIHKQCPNYVNAIKQETEKFIKFLEKTNEDEHTI